MIKPGDPFLIQRENPALGGCRMQYIATFLLGFTLLYRFTSHHWPTDVEVKYNEKPPGELSAHLVQPW